MHLDKSCSYIFDFSTADIVKTVSCESMQTKWLTWQGFVAHMASDQSKANVLNNYDYAPTLMRNIQSFFLFSLISMVGKTLTTFFQTTTIHNLDPLLHSIHNRPPTIPLITVSNHTSTLDDPLIFCALLPWGAMKAMWRGMRWCLGAEEFTFIGGLTSWFFGTGRLLPVRRGDGVFQKGMNLAAELVNRGHWIHIFPEGTK